MPHSCMGLLLPVYKTCSCLLVLQPQSSLWDPTKWLFLPIIFPELRFPKRAGHTLICAPVTCTLSQVIQAPVNKIETADSTSDGSLSSIENKIKFRGLVSNGNPFTVSFLPQLLCNYFFFNVCLLTNMSHGERSGPQSPFSLQCLAWCMILDIYWAPSVCRAQL